MGLHVAGGLVQGFILGKFTSRGKHWSDEGVSRLRRLLRPMGMGSVVVLVVS